MLSRKILISAVIAQRQISTTSCCLQKGNQLNKQIHMMKKIMVGGREKGKRRFVFNERELPKIDSVQKLSNAKGQGKESLRRITVLNKLFMKNITDLMATDTFAKNIAGYGLQISKVKISPDFRSLNIFWLAQGDENDPIIGNILKGIAGPIRHELSQLRLMGEVPRIYFVKDRLYSKAIEVDLLLRKADFGDDFVPTDPTVFMKARLELQMSLPEEIRLKIREIEREMIEEEEYIEKELPAMRNDVLGVDHSTIMKRIAVSIDKSKKAWETFETRSETILSTVTPTRDFEVVRDQVEKLSRDETLRIDFVKYLERQQFAKRNTPERKKHKDLAPNEDDDDFEDYRDSTTNDDFIEEDFDAKK